MTTAKRSWVWATAPPSDLVSVDLTDPERQTLLVGNRGQPLVFKSTDGGATWSDISAGLPTDLGEASFPHVLDSNTYILGTHKGDKGASASPGIWRTVDGGATWTQVFDEGVAGPVLASSDGNLYWILDAGGVISSSDAGVTWTLLEGRGPAGGGQFADARKARIIETPDGTWVSVSDTVVIVSHDRGASWQGVGPPMPIEHSGFTYSAVRNAVYIWQNYCDFQAGVNPVLEQAIMRLDLDVSPQTAESTVSQVSAQATVTQRAGRTHGYVRRAISRRVPTSHRPVRRPSLRGGSPRRGRRCRRRRPLRRCVSRSALRATRRSRAAARCRPPRRCGRRPTCRSTR